jgi:hypothetical protein
LIEGTVLKGAVRRLSFPGSGSTKDVEAGMNQRVFSVTAGIIFLLIAVGHLLRILLGLPFVVQKVSIPMWVSGLAAIITGYLAYAGLRLAKKPGAKP